MVQEPAATYFGTIVTIRIDRPLGSRHPHHGYLYPVNYGFVPNVPGRDGHDLDAYLLGVAETREALWTDAQIREHTAC